MGRWLGIDHGHKRIGLAVGDTQARMASPVGMASAERHDTVEQILAMARDYQVEGLLVGWPINADGSEGPQGVMARRFASELAKQTKLPVRIWDERLSSFVADQALRGLLTRKKKRARQDAIAAAAFLQDFLSRDGEQTAHAPDDLPWPQE